MTRVSTPKRARVAAAAALAGLVGALASACDPVAGYPGGVLQDESDLAAPSAADLAADADDAGYVSGRRDGSGDGILDLATVAHDLATGADLAGPAVNDTLCDACEEKQCRDVDGNDWYAYCFLDDTPITDGPGAGKKWSQLCIDTLACARRTGCAAKDPQACYCGDGVSDTTCLGQPAGPCRAEFEAAAETTHVADVIDRLADPSYPVGAAFNLLRYCEVPICGASCIGGGGGRSDGGTTTAPDLATRPADLATRPDLAGAGCADLDQDGRPDCNQTLVTNARFDADVTGWSADYGATAAWQPPPDALGSAGSGSIVVTNTNVAAVNGTSMAGAGQCIAATAGATYRLLTQVRIAAGQGAGAAALATQLFASADCSGAAASAWTSPSTSATGAWTLLSGSVTAPATARSLRVRLVALKQFRDAAFAAQFDNPLVETP